MNSRQWLRIAEIFDREVKRKSGIWLYSKFPLELLQINSTKLFHTLPFYPSLYLKLGPKSRQTDRLLRNVYFQLALPEMYVYRKCLIAQVR